jgi:hypothetical protein
MEGALTIAPDAGSGFAGWESRRGLAGDGPTATDDDAPGGATAPTKKSDNLTGGGAALEAAASRAERCISASVVRGSSRKSRPSTRKSDHRTTKVRARLVRHQRSSRPLTTQPARC